MASTLPQNSCFAASEIQRFIQYTKTQMYGVQRERVRAVPYNIFKKGEVRYTGLFIRCEHSIL